MLLETVEAEPSIPAPTPVPVPPKPPPPQKRRLANPPVPKPKRKKVDSLFPGDSNEKVCAWLEQIKLKPKYISTFREEGVTADEIFYDVDEQLLLEDFELPKMRVRRLMDSIQKLRQSLPKPSEVNENRAEEATPNSENMKFEDTFPSLNDMEADPVEESQDLPPLQLEPPPQGVPAEIPVPKPPVGKPVPKPPVGAPKKKNFELDSDNLDFGSRWKSDVRKELCDAIATLQRLERMKVLSKDRKKIQNAKTKIQSYFRADAFLGPRKDTDENLLEALRLILELKKHSSKYKNSETKGFVSVFRCLHRLRNITTSFNLVRCYQSLLALVRRYCDEDDRTTFKRMQQLVGYTRARCGSLLNLELKENLLINTFEDLVTELNKLKFLDSDDSEMIPPWKHEKTLAFLKKMVVIEASESKPFGIRESRLLECCDCKELKAKDKFSDPQWSRGQDVIPGKFGKCLECEQRDGKEKKKKRKARAKGKQKKKQQMPPPPKQPKNMRKRANIRSEVDSSYQQIYPSSSYSPSRDDLRRRQEEFGDFPPLPPIVPDPYNYPQPLPPPLDAPGPVPGSNLQVVPMEISSSAPRPTLPLYPRQLVRRGTTHSSRAQHSNGLRQYYPAFQ